MAATTHVQPDPLDSVQELGGALPFPGPAAEFLADPYPAYDRIRAETPILVYGSATYLTRYKDIAAVMRDERFGRARPRTGAAPQAAALAEPPAQGAARLAQMRRQSQEAPAHWVINQNPPDHARMRTMMAPAFSTAQTARLRPYIQSAADALLDAVQDNGRLDIIADFAYELPLRVISEILGVPPADRARLHHLAGDYGLYFNLTQSPMDRERTLLARAGFSEYCRNLINQPSPGGPGMLLESMLDGQAAGRLSSDELLANFAFLFIAGFETTGTLISNGLLALLRHPDQLRRLQENPDLIASAVEELLRYDAPTHVTPRWLLADVELSGHTFRKDELVILMLAAANRDPEKFHEPQRLDLGRTPNPHLSFGGGSHHCMGIHPARLEAQIALSTLVRRLPRMALIEQPLEWVSSLQVRRLKALPVQF